MLPLTYSPLRKSRCGRRVRRGVRSLTALLCAASVAIAFSSASANSPEENPWDVTILLPPRIIAGQPATLAVLSADGKLAPGVSVELGSSLLVKTDDTGRAFFTAPADASFLIAKTAAASSTSLVDRAPAPNSSEMLDVTPFTSLVDGFAICGAGFRGDADANRVTLNGKAALVLAASPECLVVLPGPRATVGEAKIAIDAAGNHWEGATTLVSLQFETPKPAIEPQTKGRLVLEASGTGDPLEIVVQNESPGVVRFLSGDTQTLRTSGGSPNSAAIEIETIRSGDFSFHAQLAPQPDPSAAEQYLRAALTLTPKQFASDVKNMAKRLSRHPTDVRKVQRKLDRILPEAMPGDFHTLLEVSRRNL